MIHDGHIHTPFCPHGTKDSLRSYCEKAIELGIEGITFAEHAPLPATFTDPTPQKDSAMSLDDLFTYFAQVAQLKKEFAGRLTILTGLEVDFIEGFEKETKKFLDEIGPQLDDAILSVHFLKVGEEYFCLDYSPEVFGEVAAALDSVDHVYDLYYKTVASSITTDLGRYKPKRIGHMTLVRKFQKKFAASRSFTKETSHILSLIKQYGYELDYNGAGCIKPLCQEPYPYDAIIEEAIALDIPLVYGSDAHQVKGLFSGFDQLNRHAILQRPTTFA